MAVGDALYRTGHLDASPRDARLGARPAAAGVVRARACAPLLSPLAMSRPESLLRYWLASQRPAEPAAAGPIRDASGRVVAHADLGYEDGGSRSSTRDVSTPSVEQFGRDIDRYSLMAADGWLVLRFAAGTRTASTGVVDRSRGRW